MIPLYYSTVKAPVQSAHGHLSRGPVIRTNYFPCAIAHRYVKRILRTLYALYHVSCEPLRIFWNDDTTCSTRVPRVLSATGWKARNSARSRQHAWYSCRGGCIIISENPQGLATHMVQWATKVMTLAPIRNTWKEGAWLLWPAIRSPRRFRASELINISDKRFFRWRRISSILTDFWRQM